MKKIFQLISLAFFLYLLPFLLCVENDSNMIKLTSELQDNRSARNKEYLNLENNNAGINPNNSTSFNYNRTSLQKLKEANNFKFSEVENKESFELEREEDSTNPFPGLDSSDRENKEFKEIINFFQTSLKIKTNFNTLNANKNLLSNKIKLRQSYDLYKIRLTKMRKKKEIIIKKIFELFPLLGEILGLTDVEKIYLIINKLFLIRETDLIAKYITMWDTNVNFTVHSAKVLLNMLLCNTKFNKLRCILNLLMEGLCKGDTRSINIFKEIIITVIIDSIMKTRFRYFNDIQAKFNLIRLFNIGFVYSPILKVQFLEKMLISEKLKEMITFMILKLKSKEEIDILMNINIHRPLEPFVNLNDTSIKNDDKMMPNFLDFHERILNNNENRVSQDAKSQLTQEQRLDAIMSSNLENLLEDSTHVQKNYNSELKNLKNFDANKAALNFKINYNNNEKNNNNINIDKNINNLDDALSINSDRDPDNEYDDLYDKNILVSQSISSIRKLHSFPTTNNNHPKNIFNNNNLDIYEKDFNNKKTLSKEEAMNIFQTIKLESEIRENESIALNMIQKSDKALSNKYMGFNPNDEATDGINYRETKIIDPEHLPYNEKQKIRLSEIKDQIKNEYNQMLYNMTYQPMPDLEEYIPHFQVGISKRTIYPKYKKHLENLMRLNELLDPYPINMPMGSIDVSSPNSKDSSAEQPVKPIIITKNINGVNVSMQFKEKENMNNNISETIRNNEFRFKSFMNIKSKMSSSMQTNICLATTKQEDFASKSFQQLVNYRYNDADLGQKPQPYKGRYVNHPYLQQEGKNNAYSSSISDQLIQNKYNPNLLNKGNDESNNQSRDYKNDNYNGSINNYDQITDKSTNSIPQIRNIVNNPNKNIKVIFPKEIHTTYQVNKMGTKTIEINQDNPTKKLIIDKLLPKEAFDDFINQEEKPSEELDPSGLYNVLKNIQSRKCSCSYLCIEIGTIYGDFSDLAPKNITIPYNTNKNVHFVIKPILIVNNTTPDNPPYDPSYNPGNSTNFTDLFLQEEDCDDLKIMGVGVQKTIVRANANYPGNFNRFKETSMSLNSNAMSTGLKSTQNRMKGVNFNRIQRKFYRKVAIGEEIYSQDTFKQGLNILIVQRDKKYTKLFERTFDTNNNMKESEELAEIIRDTPCSKIIILTGIGKWMGAMTPALIKEIKQIGGPDLNNLYSPDEDDTCMADHAFILVGRKGLCRYNGIFRIKNYDLSKAMQKLFPDSSSDPNDCFFEDTGLENQKNRLSEKKFFHLIDLRLTLNINNDNRFAWDAPTVSQVSPYRGSIHGGQEVKIGGFNFGTHTTDIKEILIGGVICGDFINLSPNLLSCVTRASTILGPGPKNVIIKLRNGYESPQRTCNVFEYVGDSEEAVNDLKKTIVTVQKMQNLPIYMNSNYHDQDISLFDHLKFNNRFYKEKLKPDHSNHLSLKLDNMVKANYNEIIDMVSNQSNMKPRLTGLRRKRFGQLMSNLENCETDKNKK